MHPGPVMHFSLPHLFLFFLVLVVCHGCERSRQCVTRATCTPRFVGLYNRYMVEPSYIDQWVLGCVREVRECPS